MESLVQDFAYSMRSLLRRPGFTLVAVLTLALGIGANTAIFSVVNGALLRPLPFPDSERIVLVRETTRGGTERFPSYADFLDYRGQSRAFDELSALAMQTVNLTGREEPDRIRGGFVSSNFFDMLGVAPAHGRFFAPGEDEPGAERVAVVDYGVWQRRFGADPGFLGTTLVLNNDRYTVVGITPEEFSFPVDDIEVWLPASSFPNYSLDRTAGGYGVIGRLAGGVSPEQATAELGAVAARLADAHPGPNRATGVVLTGLRDFVVDNVRTVLFVLLGVVGFVLLITCANLANLVYARNLSRLRGFAVRAALGASRARLVRLLLAETILLGLLGGAAGLLLSVWGLEALVGASPVALPRAFDLEPDARVLGFAFGVSVLAGLLFGLVPAVQLSRPDVQRELKEGGQRAGDGPGRHRARGAFVVSQVAISLVLLVGTGLCMRSFVALLDVSPGFAPERLLSMEYRIPANKYPEEAAQLAFHRQVLERVRAVPGVESAAYVMGLPFSGNGGSVEFTLPDRPSPGGEQLRAGSNVVSPGYFETMRIPVLAGRTIAETDGPEAAPVIVVNQAMARRYWPGEDPIGRQVRFASPDVTATVVGVVGDTKQYGLDEDLGPQVFASYAQNPHIFATLVVRTAAEPMALSRAVTEAVWSVDPDQPVWKVRSVESLIDRDLGFSRSLMLTMSAFAALALALTALGIFGVASSTVSQRTHEIGVRLALGARPGDVLRLVLGQGLALALAGAAVGLVAALALSRYLESLLFGVSARDPLTFAAVAAALLAIAALATWLPARRATRIAPIEALRYE